MLVVNVKPGISTTDARGKGFEEAVKGKPGVEYLGQEYYNDDPAKASSIVTADARQAPRPQGHLRREPVLRRGRRGRPARRPASSDDVKIVGFDAGPKQVKDLEEGIVQALIAQKPADIGARACEQAVRRARRQADQEGDRDRLRGRSPRTTSTENADVLYKPEC